MVEDREASYQLPAAGARGETAAHPQSEGARGSAAARSCRLARFSAPAPDGLIGGYPLTIGDRSVSLDLPASVSLEEAHAYNARIARADGIGTIEADGTVIFTEEAVVAVAGLDPRLAEPLGIDDLPQRARLLQDVIAGMNG